MMRRLRRWCCWSAWRSATSRSRPTPVQYRTLVQSIIFLALGAGGLIVSLEAEVDA